MIGHLPTICFSSVSFSFNGDAYKSNAYIDPSMNIISPSTYVLDLGISMSSNCTLTFTFVQKMLQSDWLDTENIYHERSPSNVNPV